jgi:hypothetical protein
MLTSIPDGHLPRTEVKDRGRGQSEREQQP